MSIRFCKFDKICILVWDSNLVVTKLKTLFVAEIGHLGPLTDRFSIMVRNYKLMRIKTTSPKIITFLVTIKVICQCKIKMIAWNNCDK